MCRMNGFITIEEREGRERIRKVGIIYYVEKVLKLMENEYFLLYNGGTYASIEVVKKVSLRPERIIVKGITRVDGKLQVSLIDDPVIENDLNAKWVKGYRKQFERELVFFE